LIEDGGIATAYLEQWKALRNAGSGHPGDLADSNGTPTAVGGDQPGKRRASAQFTRARQRVDLKALGDVVDGAKEGVLFLMFIPGGSGVLGNVEKLIASRPDLVVRGVVSELPHGREDEKTGDTTTVRVHVVGGADGAITKTVEVVQPEGKLHPAAFWAAETTHDQFKQGIGWAIIHSKVLVVDPFSDDPTVVAGSHNFSISASEHNDENFVVVRGDPVLAEAYAVNVDSAWRHYASRIASPHPDLAGHAYLDALLDDRKADEAFWHLG
jgi:phosphatidylserine/phosphatidylglycerophosphate/cardiolipin synthase-like enzyme